MCSCIARLKTLSERIKQLHLKLKTYFFFRGLIWGFLPVAFFIKTDDLLHGVARQIYDELNICRAIFSEPKCGDQHFSKTPKMLDNSNRTSRSRIWKHPPSRSGLKHFWQQHVVDNPYKLILAIPSCIHRYACWPIAETTGGLQAFTPSSTKKVLL